MKSISIKATKREVVGKKESPKIKYIPIAKAMGEAIERVYKNQSISSLYYG